MKAENSKETIISKAVKFYNKNSITQAHKFLLENVEDDVMEERLAAIAPGTMMDDIFEALKTLESRGNFNIRFTTLDPKEMPTILSDSYTSLACKVTECCEKLNSCIDRAGHLFDN